MYFGPQIGDRFLGCKHIRELLAIYEHYDYDASKSILIQQAIDRIDPERETVYPWHFFRCDLELGRAAPGPRSLGAPPAHGTIRAKFMVFCALCFPAAKREAVKDNLEGMVRMVACDGIWNAFLEGRHGDVHRPGRGPRGPGGGPRGPKFTPRKKRRK